MQDRPTARELVEAVAAFLEAEIIPTLSDPRLRYRGLIAANVLGIVSRELAVRDASLVAERQQLARLLGQDIPAGPSPNDDLVADVDRMNREVCRRIRAGEFDSGPEFDAALNFAEGTVIEKLRVNSPRYLARVAT
jgi:hypothetical protein